jgi:hypothetical protein
VSRQIGLEAAVAARSGLPLIDNPYGLTPFICIDSQVSRRHEVHATLASH